MPCLKNYSSQSQPLTIETWSATTNGIRISDTEVKLGLGGTGGNPTNRITFTPTQMNFDAGSNTAINFNKNLTMNSNTATDRQIWTGYLNLANIASTPQSTGTQIYQSGASSFWDNNVNGGNLTIAMNTSGGVQVIPMTLSSTFVDCNLPFRINTLGNYLQFPDGSQQTTAYTGVVSTSTVSYTSNITLAMPTGCKFIDVLVVGRGGNCGNPDIGPPLLAYGGTGSGGNSIWASGIPMYAGEQLTLSFSTTSTTGATQITYLGNVLAKAFNGNDGQPGAGSASGGTSNTANPSVGDTTFGTWTSAFGNAGTNGGTTTIPVMGSKVSCPKGISIWGVKQGCGQRSTDNATPTGVITITYHIY